jgi:nucleoside-diphosphate-sugar epimerase
MSTVVITGGNGGVGRWIVDRFADREERVVSIDLSTPDVRRDGVEFRAADLTEQGEASELIGRASPDVVIHAAAVPTGGVYAGGRTFETNVVSTYNVLEAAGAEDAKVVWFSSGALYGALDGSDEYPVDERTSTRPTYPYAASKLAGEAVAELVANRDGVPVASFRPTWVQHPGDYTGLQSRLDEVDLEDPDVDGAFWWYVDVRDVARAVESAVDAVFEGHQVFNLDSGDNPTEVGLSALLEAIYDREPDRDLPGGGSGMSIQKADAMLDWRPRHTLTDGATAAPDVSAFVTAGNPWV